MILAGFLQRIFVRNIFVYCVLDIEGLAWFMFNWQALCKSHKYIHCYSAILDQKEIICFIYFRIVDVVQ